MYSWMFLVEHPDSAITTADKEFLGASRDHIPYPPRLSIGTTKEYSLFLAVLFLDVRQAWDFG